MKNEIKFPVKLTCWENKKGQFFYQIDYNKGISKTGLVNSEEDIKELAKDLGIKYEIIKEE